MKKMAVILFLAVVLLLGTVQAFAGVGVLPGNAPPVQGAPDNDIMNGIPDVNSLMQNMPKTGPVMNISIEESMKMEPMRPAGGLIMTGYLIFFFIFVRGILAVKVYGREQADAKNETLIRELHINPKSRAVTDVDMTGLFDYSRYPAIKVKWNPKAFRNKTDVTIRYLYDRQVVHQDFFANKKEAVFERIIEMVEKNNAADPEPSEGTNN